MATSKSPIPNVDDLGKNNPDSQNINIFSSTKKTNKIKELARTKGKYPKYVIPKPEPSKIYNPDIDAERDHIRVSHFAFIYINLIKETYETLGLDYGETRNEIEYVNRLIDNPLEFNLGGGMGDYGSFFDGSVPVPTGNLPFVGKSDEQKRRMCGWTGSYSPQEALARGLITNVNIPCPPHTIEFNKCAGPDLVAILNEINQLGWFNCRISSAFRRSLSAGGHSRHQIGLAVDINGGRGGNPWFAASISKNFPEPTQGSGPPWSMKDCPYHGTYDRSKCIWHWGHSVVKIFQNHGWGWGGSYGDVMHFSIDGH